MLTGCPVGGATLWKENGKMEKEILFRKVPYLLLLERALAKYLKTGDFKDLAHLKEMCKEFVT